MLFDVRRENEPKSILERQKTEKILLKRLVLRQSTFAKTNSAS